MLQAIEIYKTYDRSVLQGVTFEAKRGEITGIAGINGSGKSTLLGLLTTLAAPDSGEILLDGAPLAKNPGLVKKHLGYVPQEASLFEELTCLDNIKFWAAAYGRDYRAAAFDVDCLRKRVKTLSGGMKKRLSIALSLLNDPDYLILDEPSAALDLAFKKHLFALMAGLKEQGRAVVFTSHQPDELLLCDKLYMIRGGRFVFEGSPGELNREGRFEEELMARIVGGM